jgi:glycosyltransferase involved in cell wall biosynthesis
VATNLRAGSPLKICLISIEIFAWGKYGGFGRATRTIGKALAERGLDVTAVVPRRGDQKPVEYLDGIRVLGFNIREPLNMLRLFKEAEADIYHSQEPSFGSFLAQKYHPDKKHYITCRDTRLFSDWLTEFRLPTLSKIQVLSNWLYEDNIFVHQAVRKAHKCFVAAHLLSGRVQRKYHLSYLPAFLPTPVQIPAAVEKALQPTVCFVSRLDRRKRPEKFFDLAAAFPQVQFVVAGFSRDKQWEQEIKEDYRFLPNLKFSGFINQFEDQSLSSLFSKSWILVNTAAREGLPNSFIEAAASRCAILSGVDPDGFASQFGYYVSDDNFRKGLEILIEDDFWRAQAQKGYRYVQSVFTQEKSIQEHIDIYREGLQV